MSECVFAWVLWAVGVMWADASTPVVSWIIGRMGGMGEVGSGAQGRDVTVYLFTFAINST